MWNPISHTRLFATVIHSISLVAFLTSVRIWLRFIGALKAVSHIAHITWREALTSVYRVSSIAFSTEEVVAGDTGSAMLPCAAWTLCENHLWWDLVAFSHWTWVAELDCLVHIFLSPASPILKSIHKNRQRKRLQILRGIKETLKPPPSQAINRMILRIFIFISELCRKSMCGVKQLLIGRPRF